MTNRQPASSSAQSCYDSKGTLEVMNNTIGTMGGGAVDVEGGTLNFDNNFVDLVGSYKPIQKVPNQV